ncbi:MAG: pyridoxal-dependent decarboxylase, partial [Magnetovibrio sp.]|nr:pyridoxal-dependent decarboxylase [Magnetovibrio sp.]
MKSLLTDTARRAAAYLDGLAERPVAPPGDAVARLAELGGPLPETGQAPADIVRQLDAVAGPAAIASAGPRYFGYVTGGALPAALAANWLAGAWDQNSFSVASSALGARIETIALDWLIELFGLPASSGGGFVTGATMANVSGLAAARHRVLGDAGWD